MKQEKNEKYGNGMALIYLGPSFYRVIQKGMVLREGLPEKFRVLIEKHPFLEGLLVPVGQIAAKRKELKEKETELALLYRRAEQIKEEMHV